MSNSVGQQVSSHPDYGKLVRYLLEPFLDAPEALRIDCEIHTQQARVWIRIAFEDPEKGRVYGRGGRNIQAIRTVIEAAARSVGQSVHLDIYDGSGGEPRVPRLSHRPSPRSSSFDRPSSSSRSPASSFDRPSAAASRSPSASFDRPSASRSSFDRPRTRRRTSSRFRPGGSRPDRYSR